MIPVRSLSDVHRYWREPRSSGPLHGFLLFVQSDREFPGYLSEHGMGDIDSWTDGKCRLFVFQSPPEGYLKHALETDQALAALVGEISGGALTPAQIAALGEIRISPDGEREISLKALFGPCDDSARQRKLVNEVLVEFGLDNTSHPCLIFFRSIDESRYWYVDLTGLLNQPIGELRVSLKDWFGGSELKRLLQKVGRA